MFSIQAGHGMWFYFLAPHITHIIEFGGQYPPRDKRCSDTLHNLFDNFRNQTNMKKAPEYMNQSST